jgi:hypothetical protein
LRERLEPGLRRSSSLHLLRSLSHSQLDTVAGNFSLRVLIRHEVQVPLRDLQASMCGDNIGVFDVLVIQVAETPVRILVSLGVLEFGDLTEYGHLLDQRLQSADVD